MTSTTRDGRFSNILLQSWALLLINGSTWGPYKWPYKLLTGVIHPISRVKKKKMSFFFFCFLGPDPGCIHCTKHHKVGLENVLLTKDSWPILTLREKSCFKTSVEVGANGVFWGLALWALPGQSVATPRDLSLPTKYVYIIIYICVIFVYIYMYLYTSVVLSLTLRQQCMSMIVGLCAIMFTSADSWLLAWIKLRLTCYTPLN